jgi:hypothetical protein
MSEAKIKDSPIKYVVIELIKANETKLLSSSIIVGLFKGLRVENMTDEKNEEKEQLFILLEDKDKALIAKALDFYNIMSFEVYDGATKVLSFYRASKEDQVTAFDQAAQIINELHAAQRTLVDDESVIDISTYSNIPAVFGTGVISKSSAGTQTSSRFNGTGNNKSSIHTPHGNTRWQKKEPAPSLIERAGKKPTKAAMDAMREKVIQLGSGDYTVTLPEIEGDDDDEPIVGVNDYDGEYSAQYFGCSG